MFFEILIIAEREQSYTILIEQILCVLVDRYRGKVIINFLNGDKIEIEDRKLSNGQFWGDVFKNKLINGVLKSHNGGGYENILLC